MKYEVKQTDKGLIIQFDDGTVIDVTENSITVENESKQFKYIPNCSGESSYDSRIDIYLEED